MPVNTQQALFGQALFGNAVFGLSVVTQTVTIEIEARGFAGSTGIDRMYFARINRGTPLSILSGA